MYILDIKKEGEENKDIHRILPTRKKKMWKGRVRARVIHESWNVEGKRGVNKSGKNKSKAKTKWRKKRRGYQKTQGKKSQK